MRAGRLNRRVDFKVPFAPAVDDYGVPHEQYADAQNVPIELVERKLTQAVQGNGLATTQEIAFKMRWRCDVRLGLHVLFEGTFYEIIALQEIGRRRGLECRAIARGAP